MYLRNLDRRPPAHPHPQTNFGAPRAHQHNTTTWHGQNPDRGYPRNTHNELEDRTRPKAQSQEETQSHAPNYPRRSHDPLQPGSSYSAGDMLSSKSKGWGSAHPKLDIDTTRDALHPSLNSGRSSASISRHVDNISKEGRERSDLRARSDRDGTATPSEHWEDGYDQSETPPPPAGPRTPPPGVPQSLYSRIERQIESTTVQNDATQNTNKHQMLQHAQHNPWAENGS